MNQMPSVLMMKYRFALQRGAGSLRAVKSVNYLPGFGWRPIVYTLLIPVPNPQQPWRL